MGGYSDQFTGMVQGQPALKSYFAANVFNPAIQKLELTSVQWATVTEFEALLHVIRSAIKLAQLENIFGSVYNHLLGRWIYKQLKTSVKIIDPNQDLRVQPEKLLRRKQKDHTFTKAGQQALDRMTFEVLATMAERPMSDAETADKALDHRTMLCPMYTAAETKDCVAELRLAYVKFGTTAAEFDAAATPAAPDNEPKVEAQASVSLGKEPEMDLSDSEDEDCYIVFETSADAVDENTTRDLATKLGTEFDRVYANWKKCPDWTAGAVRSFGDHSVADWRKMDVVKDGMRLDMGEFYTGLEDCIELYGYLPLMALARLAGLPSSSFNERVNSIAKKCMPCGRTSLTSVELGHVTTLRINRKWMEHYRASKMIPKARLARRPTHDIKAESGGPPPPPPPPLFARAKSV